MINHEEDIYLEEKIQSPTSDKKIGLEPEK
jgi:hypothetical protein